MALANVQIQGSANSETENILQKIEKFQEESSEFAKLSTQSRP